MGKLVTSYLYDTHNGVDRNGVLQEAFEVSVQLSSGLPFTITLKHGRFNNTFINPFIMS